MLIRVQAPIKKKNKVGYKSQNVNLQTIKK
jgi:hypothetical protein